jgi:3-oxoacyl-[acyl-carrier protein] reductase
MLKGKIVFITGSSRGIGWTIAELFAENGANLFINGVSNEDSLKERSNFLEKKYNIECTPIIADISDLSAVKDAYKLIFKKYKKLDILVNNAGILDDGLLGMIAEESIVRTFSRET